MEKITINGKEYNIKYTLRALFLFEQITHKTFKIQTLLDSYVFFYCMLLANNADTPIDWDEYIDALDADPSLFKRLNEALDRAEKKEAIFKEEGDEKDDGQKKS